MQRHVPEQTAALAEPRGTLWARVALDAGVAIEMRRQGVAPPKRFRAHPADKGADVVGVNMVDKVLPVLYDDKTVRALPRHGVPTKKPWIHVFTISYNVTHIFLLQYG